MDGDRLEDLWYYFTRAQLMEVRDLDRETMERAIKEMGEKGHSGPVCLTLGEEMDSRVEWLLFLDGEVKLVFFEPDMDGPDGLRQISRPEYGRGTMEVFEFSMEDLSEVKDILDPPKIKDETDAGCLATLADVRDLLEYMFGKEMAEKIMVKQFNSLEIDQGNLTCIDVKKVIDSLMEGVFREFVGPRKAREAAEKFYAYFGD